MKKNLSLFTVTKLLLCACVLGVISPIARAADSDIWPERVTDFVTTWDSSTGYVTVQLTAPTHSMTSLGSGNGEALPYVTKIILSRNHNYGDYVEVHVFENPAPGEQLTYVDTTVGEGLIQYKAVAYVDDCASYPEWSEIEIGQKPVDVNDAYATCNKGVAPVTIIFTAPSYDTNGNPLRAIEKIEVSRYNNEKYAYEVIGEVANPTPGEACTYEDYDVVSGESYSYRLVACTTAGSSYGTLVNVMVGLDSPVSPTNVVARVRDNGVYISWEAPRMGQTNGYIDVDELRYTILRSATGSEYEAETLAEGVAQLYYDDNDDVEIESKYTYYVRATNAQGASVGAPSNEVVVGPASTLPYIETFDSRTSYEVPTTDYAGWTYESSETACAWYINDVLELEDRTITPESGKGGMAFAGYGNYNDLQQDDYMTTGKISLAGAEEPLLKFRYYTFMGCNSTLTVEISQNGGEFEPVATIDYEGVAQEDWESFTFLLSEYKYSNIEYIQVRLHAHKGTYACPVVIDDFVIIDLPPVANLSCDVEQSLLTWDAPDNRYVKLTGYAVGMNGTWMPELPVDCVVYDFSKYADEYFLYIGIYAKYEDKYLSAPAEVDLTSVAKVENETFTVRVADGVLQVTAEDDMCVEVYTLDAHRVVNVQGSVEVELPQGLYIVKVDNAVRKVVVK